MNYTNFINESSSGCQSEASLLSLKKLTLDSAIKNNNTTPLKLKQLQDDYDISKKKYESICGKEDETANCIALQAQITSMQSAIAYSYSIRDNEGANLKTAELQKMIKKFNDSKCGEKVGSYRASIVRSIIETFQDLDKERIEEQSKYQAKQKIFFGAVFFVGVVLMITIFGKKD